MTGRGGGVGKKGHVTRYIIYERALTAASTSRLQCTSNLTSESVVKAVLPKIVKTEKRTLLVGLSTEKSANAHRSSYISSP